MALDRWIAMIILLIALAYGYTAFFTMDGSLPPFMKRSPVWPSSFPKVLSILTIICAIVVLLGLEKKAGPDKDPDIDYTRLMDYNLGQAVGLLALMVVYALLLRPAGFMVATIGFLVAGSYLLGERKFHIMIPVAVIASGGIWYIVDSVLGIYMSPLPHFITYGGN